MSDWRIEYEGRFPARMRWRGRHKRPVRLCPRTWPHKPHGPWFTGGVARVNDLDQVVFDCPGIPYNPDGDKT